MPSPRKKPTRGADRSTPKMRIRTGDEVLVISGKSKGRTGKVLRVDLKKEKVFVEGANIVKRHQRPSAVNPAAEAGVIEREGPIHVSNVALVDPKDNKPTRIGMRVGEDGKRYRFAKRSGTQID